MLLELAPDDPRWVEQVSSRPEALPFHHPAWMRVLAETYGFRPFVLAHEGGGLPVMELRGRRWVSLPFTDHVPPLGDVDPGMLEAARVNGRARRIELHADLPGGFTSGEAVRHVLELGPDAEAVRRTFHRSQVQRNIRKAEKSGVTVRRATAAADLIGTFYGLHLATRRRLGVPVQPRRFFARLWERMIEPGLGSVLIAEAEREPVAAAVFLAHGETVIYKYGASDANAWGLRPNHAIFWEAIQTACAEGRRYLDFGRTDLEDESLRAFKSHWGTEEVPLPYTTISDRPPAAARSGRALAPVIRRSPPWACRALGELLYKHAA